MKILQIASGSKGNSTYVETKNAKILIDCGISKKRIESALTGINSTVKDLDAILITHEHTDHISGLVPLINASCAKVYMTQGTYSGLPNKTRDSIPVDRIIYIGYHMVFSIKDIIVETVQTFHDAIEPIGFIIKNEDKKLVYITDTGYIHKESMEAISNADAYIFESNHDPQMLMESDRPYSTIIRILSDHGHLSNEDSAVALSHVMGNKTRYVFFAHISDECNLNEIVATTAKKVFDQFGIDTTNIEFLYCSQVKLKVIEL